MDAMVKLYRRISLWFIHRSQYKLEAEMEWYQNRLLRLEGMERRWLRKWGVFDAF